jgi:hypothetical protein
VRAKFITLEPDGLLTYDLTRNLCIPDIEYIKKDIFKKAADFINEKYLR